MNGARLPAYHRMGNAQAVTYSAAWDAANRRIVTEKDIRDQLGILPTFGLRWVF